MIILFFLFPVAQRIGSYFAADEIAILIHLVVDRATILKKSFKKHRKLGIYKTNATANYLH